MADIQINHVKDQEDLNADDDSGGSASDDDLKDVDLYQNVYMKKSKSIEKKMRQTMRAENNFIQEVKIMIKKKDIEFGLVGKDIRKQNPNLQKSTESHRVNHANFDHQKAPQTANLNHVGLQLTGVTIGNPNP